MSNEKIMNEAKNRLADWQAGVAAADTTFKVVATAADFVAPGVGRVTSAIAFVSRAAHSYFNREYIAELEKAARGERDSLPELASTDDNMGG